MEAAGKEQSEPNHAPSPEHNKMLNRKTKLQGRKCIFSSGSCLMHHYTVSERNKSWDEWKCADTMTENIIAIPR